MVNRIAPIRYLLVLGSPPSAAHLLRRALAPRYPDLKVLATDNCAAGLDFLSAHSTEVALTVVDGAAGRPQAHEVIRQVHRRCPGEPAVVVSGTSERGAYGALCPAECT